MLTRLGAGAVAEDAVGLLLECHQRIRTFAALASRLASAAGAGPDEVRDAARRVRRYFAEALPLHAQDEEESILPRLRGRDPALDDALATMAREHREHEAPLARVLGACRTLERDPATLPRVAGPLAAAAAELEAHFARHLALEEAIVFPAMRGLFSASDDAAVVREMRARRAPPAP
jgi:iron-sulfur cluster repair protein YtfE (RIC family)